MLVAIVREGEALGYGAVFLPEIVGRDALVTLGAFAGETSRLRLGTGVLPMGSRTSLLTAMAAATVQDRSAGRLVLGLGPGRAGAGALEELRLLVDTVRRLTSGESVESDGRRLRLSLIPDPPPPIWISALGPRAARTAGMVADGVLLNWCTPERVAHGRAEVAAGAEAAGRDPATVAIGVYVGASLGGDERSVTAALRAAVAEYASYPAYARQFASMGLEDEARAAADAHRDGRPVDVPDPSSAPSASSGIGGRRPLAWMPTGRPGPTSRSSTRSGPGRIRWRRSSRRCERSRRAEGEVRS